MPFRRLYQILILCFCTSLSAGALLAQEQGATSASELITAAGRLIYRDSTEALKLIDDGLSLAENQNDPTQMARAYRLIGLLRMRHAQVQRAKTAYESYLENALKGEDPVAKADAYLLLSGVTNRLGDKVTTLAHLLEALRLLEPTDNRRTFARVLNGLGNHYRDEESYSEAEGYYLRALALRQLDGDSVGLASSFQVLGNMYGKQELNDKAKASYRQSLQFLAGKRRRNEASLLTNLGIIYYRENKFDSAQYFYEKAFEVQKSIGNEYSQTVLLNNLSALMFERGSYRKSNEFALEGVELAKKVEAPKLLSALYFNLSDNYQALGDHRRSFQYYKLSDSIDYELTNAEKNAQMAELQVQYETEKKDKEIALQNVELVKADARQNLLIYVLSGLLLIAAFVYYALVRKRRANRLLTQQKILVEKREKEKALLLRELHHRVKNNFQIVSSLLNLQYYETSDEETASAIKSGQARVEAMSMIHRELYQSENITSIEMQDYVSHLIDNTAYSFGYSTDQLDLNLNIGREPLGVKHAIPVGVIINELITNSFKHAFQDVDRPELTISLEIGSEDQDVRLEISDNGPGLPEPSNEKSDSFGLELIRDLVKQLKGKLEIGEGRGSRFSIVFPYQNPVAHV